MSVRGMCVVVAGLGMALAGPAFGQEAQKGPRPKEQRPVSAPAAAPAQPAEVSREPAPTKRPAAAQPQGGPEEIAEAWQAANALGKEHAALGQMVGEWDARLRMWMAPDQPPMEASSIERTTWALDGRFIRSETTWEAMGTSFTGLGYMGYNTADKVYQHVWMDSMSTGMMHSTGSYDEATKTFTFEGRYTDPMTGEPKRVRTVTRILNENERVFEYHEGGAAEEPVKSMEIRYTRRGAPGKSGAAPAARPATARPAGGGGR